MCVASEDGVTIALDTELDQALVYEGYSREFVSKVQNLRKEMGMEVTDRILIAFDGTPEVKEAIADFKDYICNETLADSLAEELLSDCGETDLNGQMCKIRVTKA